MRHLSLKNDVSLSLRCFQVYHSQHPYLAEAVGEPYVCSVDLEDVEAVKKCVQKALSVNLPPFIPKELTTDAHEERVEKIFGSYARAKHPPDRDSALISR